ncbi:type IV pilus assembly protein PilM [Candidatus Parcubacteria bacterium]|nr:MAG: type IV pilus assembly protein PilM [Candidatus Parcubacteria bacterium]
MRFNPFRFLRQAVFPSYLGVDIGTTSIKVVEVKHGKSRPRLVNYAYLDASSYLARTNGALHASTLKLFEEEVVELLARVIKELRPSTHEALASLPIFSAFTTVLNFPQMSVSDLNKAIVFQARQYVPMPLKEVALDWMKVGEYEDEKGFLQQQILLISVPKEQIQKYRNIFQAVGLRLQTLEIESLSAVRSLTGMDPTPTLVVDIGSRSTNIFFCEGGQLKFNRQSDYGGASLTKAIVDGLHINVKRAEELKREKGIAASGAEGELSTIMLPHLDAIISEVKQAHYAYTTQFPAAQQIERLILTGGGANLRGIEQYFGREFTIPIVKAAPLSQFEYPPAMEPLVGELNPLLSVALGLTLGRI